MGSNQNYAMTRSGELYRKASESKLKEMAAEIAAAVAAGSREAMRNLEEREIAAKTEGMFYQGRIASAYEAGHRFVSRSDSGETRYGISEEQRVKAQRRFAPLMKSLGYAPE